MFSDDVKVGRGEALGNERFIIFNLELVNGQKYTRKSNNRQGASTGRRLNRNQTVKRCRLSCCDCENFILCKRQGQEFVFNVARWCTG